MATPTPPEKPVPLLTRLDEETAKIEALKRRLGEIGDDLAGLKDEIQALQRGSGWWHELAWAVWRQSHPEPKDDAEARAWFENAVAFPEAAETAQKVAKAVEEAGGGGDP